MSQSYINPLSNLSYTNKDFQSVYVELLDLAKEISYRWDPSISNESDPGVILLKLNAIIADKCNYNIDKNVLECFPLSVTQETNARQLFEQLGYYMHLNKSATTNIILQWTGTKGDDYYTIPAFTMVADYENSVVYSLIGSSDVSGFVVSDSKLNTDGSYLKLKAIQGISVKYDINGSTIITPSMLDSDNRIYFTSTDIAQNGIFITNTGSNNYSEWQRKDNLLVESLGNKYYSFGLSKDKNYCYIEFPMDAEEQFGQGIEITYIKTDGSNGNIATNIIEKFYNDLVPAENTSITLNSDNVKITNYASATDGEDFETINDAYDNYKKTVGTFNTLVTLRDYINYLNKSELVSNNFCCDRTNDIQCCYDTIEHTASIDQEITTIESTYPYDEYEEKIYSVGDVVIHNLSAYCCKTAINTGEAWDATKWTKLNVSANDDKLNAFSVKLYMLQYAKDTDTAEKFNSTFKMLDNTDLENIKTYLSTAKSVEHDIKNLDYIDAVHSHVAYFINKYPLNCTITTQYALTNTDKSEMREIIKKALYDNLNSKQINFGEAIETQYLYDTIINSDTRIKSVMIDNIEYETYAYYLDKDADGNDEWKDTILTNDDEIYVYLTTGSTTTDTITYDVNKFFSKMYTVKNHDYCVFTCMDSNDSPYSVYAIKTGNDTSFDSMTQLTVLGYNLSTAPTATALNQIYGDTSQNIYVSSASGSTFIWTLISTDDRTISAFIPQSLTTNHYYLYYALKLEDFNFYLDQYDIELQVQTTGTITSTTELGFYIPESVLIKTEIYTKSVLDGITQFYINKDKFDYTLQQNYDSTNSRTDIIKLSMWRDIKISGNGTAETASQQIPENSSIQLFAPNLVDATNYSNYVKFEMKLDAGSNIPANTSYQLGENEYIILYWRDDDSEASIYKYAAYGYHNIIKSTFIIERSLYPGTNNIGRDLVTTWRNVGTTSYPIYQRDSESDGDMLSTISTQIGNLSSNNNRLTGTKTITIQDFNKAELSSSTFCYWILNNTYNDKYYRLFGADSTSEYILQANEYFLYTDNASSYFTILGAGTTIRRTTTGSIWEVPKIDAEEVLTNGVTSLIDAWYIIPTGNSIIATENQYLTINSENYIKITNSQGSGEWNLYFTKDGTYTDSAYTTEADLTNYVIKYSEDGITWVTLPSIDFTTSTGWKAKSIYSINTAKNIEQHVHYNVQGTVGNVKYEITNWSGTTTSYEFYGSTEGDLYFMTSNQINVNNANNLDVTVVNDDQTISSMDMYVYSKYQDTTTSTYKVVYKSDGTVTITFLSTFSSGGYVSLPVHPYFEKYILSLQIDTATVTAFDSYGTGHIDLYKTISNTSTAIHSMYSNDDTEFGQFAKQYLYYDNSSTQSAYTIDVYLTKPSQFDKETVVTLGNLYAYKLPTEQYISSQISNDTISNIIGSMEINKHIFDYTYEVDENYNIENPLLPKEFVNSYHLYNSETICQLDTSNITLNIVSK